MVNEQEQGGSPSQQPPKKTGKRGPKHRFLHDKQVAQFSWGEVADDQENFPDLLIPATPTKKKRRKKGSNKASAETRFMPFDQIDSRTKKSASDPSLPSYGRLLSEADDEFSWLDHFEEKEIGASSSNQSSTARNSKRSHKKTGSPKVAAPGVVAESSQSAKSSAPIQTVDSSKDKVPQNKATRESKKAERPAEKTVERAKGEKKRETAADEVAVPMAQTTAQPAVAKMNPPTIPLRRVRGLQRRALTHLRWLGVEKEMIDQATQSIEGNSADSLFLLLETILDKSVGVKPAVAKPESSPEQVSSSKLQVTTVLEEMPVEKSIEKEEELQESEKEKEEAENKVAVRGKRKRSRSKKTTPRSDDVVATTDDVVVTTAPSDSVVTLPTVSVPQSTGFGEISLSSAMNKTLHEAGYLAPTPVQAGTITPILAGGDLIGQAKTGTGKTAAFVIPLIEMIDQMEGDLPQPLALIVVPTRELAVQVRDEAIKLSQNHDISVVACYGGKPIADQIKKLSRGADIVVGTPGRIIDLANRRALSLGKLRFVVLDEADRMLDIGFRPDIERILKLTPSTRQTLLFSATLPAPVVQLAKRYMKEPEQLDFSDTHIASETIEQYYITVDKERKFDALIRLLEREKPQQAIVFCRTKRAVDRIATHLQRVLPQVSAMHGDMTQDARDRVMKMFRAGSITVLVATDVVGRGIDISGISHIINYDIPEFCDDYVHRVGRTGRMGREGVAYTLVTSQEGAELTRIEIRINKLLKRVELSGFQAYTPPDDKEVVPPSPKPVFGKNVRRIRRAL